MKASPGDQNPYQDRLYGEMKRVPRKGTAIPPGPLTPLLPAGWLRAARASSERISVLHLKTPAGTPNEELNAEKWSR